MTSQNLELFPDDLFARKGDATPAGETRKGKDKAEVVALDAPESGSAQDPGDPEAGAAPVRDPGDGEDSSAEVRGPEAEPRGETAGADEGKPKRKPRGGGRAAAKGQATDAAPAASVLKFRLLDEVPEDLDEILRCAEGRATAPVESADAEDATLGSEALPAVSQPETPETEGPETEAEAETPEDATAPAPMALPADAPAWDPRRQTATLWKPATWTPRTRVAAAVLVLAGGLVAGWYAAMPGSSPTPAVPATPDGGDRATNAGEALPPPQAADPGPSDSRNALKTLGGTESETPAAAESESPTASEAAAPRVDVVRVEEDGSAVIAGMAAPGAEVIVLHNGAPIGIAQADNFGQWVLLPVEPLPEGPHEFGLVVKTVEGSVTLPDPAAPESDTPAAGDSGGEAGDEPALDRESRLPGPEPSDGPAQALVEAPLPPQRPAAKTTAPTPQAAPPYVVQLASALSAQGAASEWQKLRRTYPELLAQQNLTVQEADLAGRGTVFRVRTGNFETLGSARRFCAAFRRQNQPCLVVKQGDASGELEPPQTRLTRNHSW